jgi:hypothetical protein
MGKDAIRRVGARLFRQRYSFDHMGKGELLEKRPSLSPASKEEIEQEREKEKSENAVFALVFIMAVLFIFLAIMSALGGC